MILLRHQLQLVAGGAGGLYTVTGKDLRVAAGFTFQAHDIVPISVIVTNRAQLLVEEHLAVLAGVVQPDGALSCLRWLMSFIPALVALVSMCIVWFYPLTTERITQINKELKELRSYYRDVDEND